VLPAGRCPLGPKSDLGRKWLQTEGALACVFQFPHILNTPNLVAGTGAFSAAEKASASAAICGARVARNVSAIE